jgi:hypothetical protein
MTSIPFLYSGTISVPVISGGVRLQLISFLFAIVAHASQVNDLFASQCRYVRQ